MQVIKHCYSYQLAHYRHENVMLVFLPPIIVSTKQILQKKKYYFETVNCAHRVSTDQIEHL